MSPDDRDTQDILADIKAGKQQDGVDLSGKDFSYQTLAAADLKGAILKKTAFLKSDLTRADLADADLSGAFLIGATLKEASLCNATLTKADLYLANLSGADLSGACLKQANLERACLRNAKLTNADLTEANLNEADIEGADLTDAQLKRTYFPAISAITKKRNIYDRMSDMSAKAIRSYINSPDSIFYVLCAVFAAFVAGAYGATYASLLEQWLLIPASIITGVFMGLAVAHAVNYMADRASKSLTRRVKSDEIYPEIIYKGDIVHANFLLRSERYEDALEAFKEIYYKAPDRVEPRFKIARIYQIGLNDKEKAREAYLELLDIFGESLGEGNMYVIESRRALREMGD